MPHDPDLPVLISRDAALAAGLSRHQVAQRLRSARWRTVRRGRYVRTEPFDRLTDTDQHLLRLVATLDLRGDRDVASHLSAALTLGWPVPFTGPGPVTVTSGDLSRSARRRADVVVQVATTPPSDIRSATLSLCGVEHAVRITSAARTAADCLRHLPLEDCVAVVDAAVRSGATTLAAVDAVLRRQEPWPYLAHGRHAFSLLDPRRESYLESYSFVRLGQFGLRVEPQMVLRAPDGTFVARVDGWIEDGAVVLECDGREKYVAAARDRQDAGEVARSVRTATREEMRREERLRALGVVIVRWGTSDIVRRPDRVAARVHAAIGRSGRPPFTGSTSATPLP